MPWNTQAARVIKTKYGAFWVEWTHWLRLNYEEKAGGPEQQCPIVYLISDPTIPGRTKCLLDGDGASLNPLAGGGLLQLEYDPDVFAAGTVHTILDNFAALLENAISAGVQSPGE